MVDVTHGPVVELGSQASDDAIAAADYLVAVKVGAQGQPVGVRVLLKPPLQALPKTDLTGKESIPGGAAPVVLLPRKGKLLQVVHPDATVQYCTNVGGRWVWLAAEFTAMSS